MNKLDLFKAKANLRASMSEAKRSPVVDTAEGRLQAKKQVIETSQRFDPSRGRLSPEQQKTRSAHFQYAEVNRIIGLPIVSTMEKEELEEYSRQNLLADFFDKGGRLFPPQAQAVSDYEMFNGVFGSVAVGDGKTLITLMIANKAYQKGLRKILLIIPPSVLSQLTEHDIRWARNRVPISYPIHILGGKGSGSRRALSLSGKKGLYVMPYSCLSTKDTVENLEGIRPELIICDEAHYLSDRSSARTKRIMDYLDRYSPELAAISGTITTKSIRDYYHLIKVSLKKGNPLPNTTTLANEWGNIIDAEASSDGEGQTSQHAAGPLLPLVHWAQQNFPRDQFPESVAGFRNAYKHRLTTAPGSLSAEDSKLGISLVLSNSPVAREGVEGCDLLRDLEQKITDEWLTPNGDEIEHAIHTWKWLYELSAGFYNELSWPAPEIYADRKRISITEAADILDRANQHFLAGQEYARELRSWLSDNSKQGMDTPMLVGQEMARHDAENVGDTLYQAWIEWKELDFPGRPDRDSKAIRVCPYKIIEATEWACTLSQNKGALLWVYHQEIGKWLFDSLVERGIDALHCPAGDQYNAAIRDPKNANKKIVASIKSHGTGKNLQHFQEQQIVQWPRSARDAEQLLGRTHRNGQKADEIIANTNHSTEFDELNFAACLNDSLYIHQTTGNRQKLIYATYDPIPKVFSPMILRERGFQNKLLNQEQQSVMQEKFGNE